MTCGSILLLLTLGSAQAANMVTRTHLTVPNSIDEGTQIPVATITGRRPGATLAIVAGVHGAEYAPIVAAQRLLDRLQDADLRGTVRLVLVANPSALFKRTIFYSPADWQNLNRVFPGKRGGSYSERVAYALTTEIIEKCDYLVDLHAGDANETLVSYAAYDAGAEDPQVRERSHEMARAMNLPRIVRNRNRPTDPSALLYLTNTATHRRKPNIGVECGELGSTEDRYVTPMVEGVENVMRYLGMLAGTVLPNKNPMYIDSGASIRSEHNGLYYPKRKAGDYVKKGEELGTMTGLFGERLATITAPTDGLILYTLGTPPVSKGEPIVTIGVVAGR
jgi:predicted deacylase